MHRNGLGFGGDHVSPDWVNVHRVHDWRNHISEDVQEMWQTFTEPQKLAIAKMAQARADAEGWD